MAPRHDNGFRFSDTFIQRWTYVLCAAVVVIPAIGFGLGLWSDHDSAPDGAGDVALAMVIGGFVGPLLIAAVLGGEAIKHGGGLVGLLLTYGMIAAAVGKSQDVDWALWTGIAALVVAVAGFWVIGWVAKVPMYIGLPWAHGRVVQRTDAPPEPNVRSGDPRRRVKPPQDGMASGDPRR